MFDGEVIRNNLFSGIVEAYSNIITRCKEIEAIEKFSDYNNLLN